MPATDDAKRSLSMPARSWSRDTVPSKCEAGRVGIMRGAYRSESAHQIGHASGRRWHLPARLGRHTHRVTDGLLRYPAARGRAPAVDIMIFRAFAGSLRPARLVAPRSLLASFVHPRTGRSLERSLETAYRAGACDVRSLARAATIPSQVSNGAGACAAMGAERLRRPSLRSGPFAGARRKGGGSEGDTAHPQASGRASGLGVLRRWPARACR
jgi:hypothetical protein